MFVSRLDDARNDMKKEVVPTSNSKTKKHSSSTPGSKRRNPKILHELNEYLFDLFDANCMEDFQRMEEFEEHALEAYMDLEYSNSNSVREFNHRQYELHQEFIALFEGMIEKFLRQYKYSSDELYREIDWYLKYRDLVPDRKDTSRDAEWKSFEDEFQVDSSNPSQDAFEIIEVIAFYTDFEKWSNMMMEIVRTKKQFQSFKEKINKAVHQESDLAINKDRSMDLGMHGDRK